MEEQLIAYLQPSLNVLSKKCSLAINPMFNQEILKLPNRSKVGLQASRAKNKGPKPCAINDRTKTARVFLVAPQFGLLLGINDNALYQL